MPAGIFGNPTSGKPTYVLEAITCYGNETNVFDCELSPWGVEGCDDSDILAIACSQQKLQDNFELSVLMDESHKITNALTNLLGLPNKNHAKHMIPIVKFRNYKFGFCLSRNFDDLEATHLCQSMGYECGTPNYDNFITTQSIESQGRVAQGYQHT